MSKQQLLIQREQLLTKLQNLDQEISHLDNMEKPYVAAISSYSGGGKVSFKTEEQARRKFEEYCGKTYYRNGLTNGAYLYKHNHDGSKTLLEVKEMGRPDFYPYEFDREAV